MSIAVGEYIGLEAHPGTDQFVRLDAGTGKCVMAPPQDELTFEQKVTDGWSIQVPAGTWPDVIDTGDQPLRLYAIYAPVHHAPGIVQETDEDAEREEELGVDELPASTVQPEESQPDQHAG